LYRVQQTTKDLRGNIRYIGQLGKVRKKDKGGRANRHGDYSPELYPRWTIQKVKRDGDSGDRRGSGSVERDEQPRSLRRVKFSPSSWPHKGSVKRRGNGIHYPEELFIPLSRPADLLRERNSRTRVDGNGRGEPKRALGSRPLRRTYEISRSKKPLITLTGRKPTADSQRAPNSL